MNWQPLKNDLLTVFEMASQTQSRLTDDFKIMKKIKAINSQNILGSPNAQVWCEIAQQFQSEVSMFRALKQSGIIYAI